MLLQGHPVPHSPGGEGVPQVTPANRGDARPRDRLLEGGGVAVVDWRSFILKYVWPARVLHLASLKQSKKSGGSVP